jgi:hypothetical protein
MVLLGLVKQHMVSITDYVLLDLLVRHHTQHVFLKECEWEAEWEMKGLLFKTCEF